MEYLTDTPSPFGYPQPAVKLYKDGQYVRMKYIDVQLTVPISGAGVHETYKGYVEDYLEQHTEFDSAEIVQYEIINGREQEHQILTINRK